MPAAAISCRPLATLGRYSREPERRGGVLRVFSVACLAKGDDPVEDPASGIVEVDDGGDALPMKLGSDPPRPPAANT